MVVVVWKGRGLGAVVAVIVSCSGNGGPAPGAVGWPCPNDNNCRAGLICIDGACAEGVRDAGRPVVDAGPVDTGEEPVDAGPIDTGVDDAGVIDAGCPTPPRLSAIQSQIFGAAGEPACNQLGCHGVAAAGGVRLDEGLAEVHAALSGPTTAVGAPETDLVVPGDPNASRLYRIVSDRNPLGNGGPMPPDAPLDACSVDTIRQWIANGAPQN